MMRTQSEFGEWMAVLNDRMTAAAGVPREVLHGQSASGTAMAALRYALTARQYPRILSKEEAEEMDRREVYRLYKIEDRRLAGLGVTDCTLVYQAGPATGKVPYIRHDATGARLVDFTPASTGRRVQRNEHTVRVVLGRGHETQWLHCGGCDMDHAADSVFVLGKPCVMCGWLLEKKADELVVGIDPGMPGGSTTAVVSVPRKCALCRRAPAEVINAKDSRASICHPCNASWNRAWQVGEQGMFADGHSGAGRLVRICMPPPDLDGNSTGDLYDHNNNIWVEWMEGSNHMQAGTDPWWLRPVPSLREWLGDRASDLPPEWLAVLREHPEPRGMIVAWHWDHSGPDWILLAADKDDAPGCGTYVPPDLAGVFDREDGSDSITCWMEALQMALFIRHPDVLPEPRKAPYPWSPEDQHETIARDA